MAPFKGGFLFSTSSDGYLLQLLYLVQTFAGGDERSSRDGTPIYLRFYTPTGTAVSNDSSNF